MRQNRAKGTEELRKDAASLRDKLWTLTVDLAAGKVKNVREIRAIKRAIARIETIISQNAEKKTT